MSLAGCQLLQPSAPRPTWPEYLAAFEQDYFAANPPFAVQQGRHGFDGQLPDWSAAGIDHEVTRLKESRKLAHSYPDDELTPRQRFERAYVLSRIDTELFWLDQVGSPFHNPAFYLNNGLDPSVYLTRPYAPAAKRLKAFTRYLRAIPTAAAQIRANLRTPLPRTFVEQAMKAFGGYAEYYK